MPFFRVCLLTISACFWLTCGTTALASVQSGSTEALSTEDILRAGENAIADGQYDEALQRFTQSIEQSPAIGYGNRCLVHLQMQHYSSAIEDCTQSLALKENAEVRMDLGLAYAQAGKHDLAIAQYDSILLSNFTDYRVHYNLALSKAATGQHHEAVSAYTHALRELPPDTHNDERADIYRDRGASYLVLADYAAAVTDLNTAISRNPNDVWAYFNRGCAYHRSSNFLPALQDFNWVIENDEQNAQAYFNRGLIYAHLEQPDAAIESLEDALQYFSTDSQSEEVFIPVRQARQLIKHLRREQAGSAVFSVLGDHAVSS